MLKKKTGNDVYGVSPNVFSINDFRNQSSKQLKSLYSSCMGWRSEYDVSCNWPCLLGHVHGYTNRKRCIVLLGMRIFCIGFALLFEI